MKSQQIVDKFKTKGWLKSALDAYCYESSDNQKITNLFYKSVEDTIETQDGYMFIFDDKSSVEYDGKIFIVHDAVQTDYKIKSL